MVRQRSFSLRLLLVGVLVFSAAQAQSAFAITPEQKAINKLTKQVNTLLTKLAILDAKALSKGDKGDQGPQGVQGLQGPTGPKGEQGIAGSAAAKGDTGSTGAKGDKGDVGAAGPKGDKGDTGSTGAKGDTGATGATGAQGSAGADGGLKTIVAIPSNGVVTTLGTPALVAGKLEYSLNDIHIFNAESTNRFVLLNFNIAATTGQTNGAEIALCATQIECLTLASSANIVVGRAESKPNGAENETSSFGFFVPKGSLYRIIKTSSIANKAVSVKSVAFSLE